MSYNLFLDDVRMPVDVGNYFYPVEYRKLFRLSEWVIVRNYDEFVKCIEENGLPALVSFDHDLADEHYSQEFHDMPELYDTGQEKTGYDCAKYFWNKMVEEENYSVQILCHSMNPDGKDRINSVFANQ